jgi:hypothetical protein
VEIIGEMSIAYKIFVVKPEQKTHERSKCRWEDNINKKFWKELICLLSLHYLKMSFALKPAFAPT